MGSSSTAAGRHLLAQPPLRHPLLWRSERCIGETTVRCKQAQTFGNQSTSMPVEGQGGKGAMQESFQTNPSLLALKNRVGGGVRSSFCPSLAGNESWGKIALERLLPGDQITHEADANWSSSVSVTSRPTALEVRVSVKISPVVSATQSCTDSRRSSHVWCQSQQSFKRFFDVRLLRGR